MNELRQGDKVRINWLDITGLCTGITRDARGNVAAEVAYVDKMGVIQKTVLAVTLLHVWREFNVETVGWNYVPVTGVSREKAAA